MAENTRLVHATPEQVWEVLSDGWLYPVWVVGASRMREVDVHWPAVGSKLHHSVGLWPLLIDDNTEVTATVPGHSVTLRARAWPVGEAEVHIRLVPVGAETEVRITEDAVSVSDGGGIVSAARAPVTGRDHIARFIVGTLARFGVGASISVVSVNGRPAVLATRDGAPLVLATIDAGQDGIRRLLMIVNPAKLGAFGPGGGTRG